MFNNRPVLMESFTLKFADKPFYGYEVSEPMTNSVVVHLSTGESDFKPYYKHSVSSRPDIFRLTQDMRFDVLKFPN